MFRLLLVGADFRRKGGDDLLPAFSAIDGPAELIVVTKCEVPAIDRVWVVDDLGPNDDRLVELYRAADAFVLPSGSEAFVIAAIEASAVGLPVVATRTGGLFDVVVDGESGLLVDPGDIGQLTAALTRLAGDPHLRQRMGWRPEPGWWRSTTQPRTLSA